MKNGDSFNFSEYSPSFESIASDAQAASKRREEEFRERLQLVILQWIQVEIPSWQPERSPRYRQSSQALNAPPPGNDHSPAGLVYFKNVFDPCWSNEDVARLHETAYPWMLMILSPCERFYFHESRFMEIISNLHNLTIWRPDTPSRAELENLRGLIFKISPEILEGDPSGNNTIEEVHKILTDLYIHRGEFIGSNDRTVIAAEITEQSLCRYLSVRLSSLSQKKIPAANPNIRTPAEAVKGKQTLEWVALLTGDSDLRNGSIEQAQEKLIGWWMISAEELSTRLTELPEAFMTIRFRSEVKSVEGPLLVLKPIIHSLRAGTFSLTVAVNHLARNFVWDTERLLSWKRSLDNLAGLIRWLPKFSPAQEYLGAAFLLGRKDLDHLCSSLLQSTHEPCQFLEVHTRNEFDERFLEFKKSYMDYYYALHEDARQLMRGLRNDESKIDPVSLHNLEMLSGLRYTDKSYLNRVKVLARWVQGNQCSLPLRQVLERYPRCLCNFNPCSNQPPADSATRINGIIREGIEYFRTILRKCDRLILEELNDGQADDESIRQITNLLSHDSISRLKLQPIKILNGIIGKHPRAFMLEVRNYNRASKPLW